MTLRGPLLEEGRITTLVGPMGPEMAALTVAIAAGRQTGRSMVPGLDPQGLGAVMVCSYAGDWAGWRGLSTEVADVAGIADPGVRVDCLSDPWGKPAERERDPDPEAQPFWDRARGAQIETEIRVAKSIGRQLAPCLTVVVGYGLSAASSFGTDLGELYAALRGRTALVVETHEPAWAGTYGPIHRLADLRAADSGVDAFLERVAARYAPEVSSDEPQPPPSEDGAPQRGGDVYALLDELGLDAVRQLTDGTSAQSKRLKALARARGLTGGALWHAAKEIAAQVQSHERVPGCGPGVLFGRAAVFGQWREVDQPLLGHYLECIGMGAFTQTLAEEAIAGRKVTFQHGGDPRFGHQSLGPITVLKEDAAGLYYEVELDDADHCWALAPWLATGRYGGSLTFEVLRDSFVRRPGSSAHNPRGLPERVITEIRLQEFGPVWSPAYRGTSCGVRFQ